MLINTHPFYGSCSFLSVSKLMLNNELWVAKEDFLSNLSVSLCPQIKQKQTQVLYFYFKFMNTNTKQLLSAAWKSYSTPLSNNLLNSLRKVYIILIIIKYITLFPSSYSWLISLLIVHYIL